MVTPVKANVHPSSGLSMPSCSQAVWHRWTDRQTDRWRHKRARTILEPLKWQHNRNPVNTTTDQLLLLLILSLYCYLPVFSFNWPSLLLKLQQQEAVPVAKTTASKDWINTKIIQVIKENISAYSVFSRSCSRNERTTGVASIASSNIFFVFWVAGAVAAVPFNFCSFSATFDVHVMYPISRRMTASSGGTESSPKHSWDTRSMKKVLHLCLYWLCSSISFLKQMINTVT